MPDTYILALTLLPATIVVLSALTTVVFYHRHNRRLMEALEQSRTLVGELTNQTRASSEQLRQLAEDIRGLTPYIADLEKRVTLANTEDIRVCIFDIRRAYDMRDPVLLETALGCLRDLVGDDE